MPLLEAPKDLSESSPEISLNQEEPEEVPAQIPILPVTAAQVRLPTPEPVAVEHLQQNNRNHERNFRVQDSYDRDILEAEEENYFPAYVHLLPVVLPTQVPEPTLDELLRRVTSRTDLHNVESVSLRVISYTLSLSHLALFLPRLQHLDLSGSVLCSLRDLGYGLIYLSHLNVSNCGLNSFDGTSGFPALRVLIADDNMIQRISSLTDLVLLQHLSVRNNRISELSPLTFLGLCSNLMELHLEGNSVCHQAFYRETLQRNIPSLQMLDGLAIDNNSGNIETMQTNAMQSLDSDDVSSLSSASDLIAVEASKGINHLSIEPNSNCDNATVSQQRPDSVSAISRSNSLSSGFPVMGSVVTLARQRLHRKRHMVNAWASSDSSSYSATSSNNSTRPPSSVSSNGSYDCMSATQTIVK